MANHDILLSKLYRYGIHGIAHTKIKYVALNGKTSSTLDMIYGVPQGSILGPLLFVIYINDMPNICKLSKFILYADDANIIITGKNITEIEKSFEELAKNLEKWVNANGLVLNLKKTNYMIFANQKVQNYSFKPIYLTTIF